MDEILLDKGVKPIPFLTSYAKVKEVMGDKQTYEPWMGGNLNFALTYPGVVIGFGTGSPNEKSKVSEFFLGGNSQAKFFGKNVFGEPIEFVEGLIKNKGLAIQPEEDTYFIDGKRTRLDMLLDEQNVIQELHFWLKAKQFWVT